MLRRTFLLAFAFSLASILAYGPLLVRATVQAGTAKPVSISQEHHHHLVIENAYLKAYEVEVPAHESTLLHQHDYDYIYVVLGGAQVTNAVEGKPEVEMYLPDTTVNFAHGPFAHVAGNVGDTPFRNVTISLLRPQGEVKSYYPSADAALSPAARQTSNQTSKIAGVTKVMTLETGEVRVFAVAIDPSASWPPSTEKHPRLIILLDKMKDMKGPREKSAPTFPVGLLKWIPAGQSWAFDNDTQYEKRFVVLEFKD